MTHRTARYALTARAFGLWCAGLTLLVASSSCSSDDDPGDNDGVETGGGSETGGSDSGGSDSGGTDSGGSDSGGTDSGGSDSGGTDSGGSDSGGAYTGGSNSGGSNSGGAHTGGAPTGGANTGGAHTGGSNAGGTHTGGSHTGGVNTGGGPTGGSGGANTGGSHSGGSGGTGGGNTGGGNTGGSGGNGGGNTGGSGGMNTGGSGGTGGTGGGNTGGTGGTGGTSGVQVFDNVQRAGVNCVRIRTANADYYFDKAGAGFASIVDNSGRDWVSWKRGSGPGGEYRGIPNMGDCCHPGYTGATTSITAQTATRAEVRSVGPGWETRWEFFPNHAKLTVVDAPTTYYLLYEGTPGGAIGPEDYIGRADGSLTPLTSTNINTDFPNPEWAYFLDAALGRALIVKHGQDDAIADTYWTFESMTVLGYGRTCTGACKGMTASGQTLLLAFSDDTTPAALTSFANGLY